MFNTQIEDRSFEFDLNIKADPNLNLFIVKNDSEVVH